MYNIHIMVEFVLPINEEVEAPLGSIFRKILANRGVRFEDLTLVKTYDPFLMEGMYEAVDRISFAIKRDERILIHGDYDADGITSLALLFRVLRDFGVKVIPYIPNRFSEGYGFSTNAIRKAKEEGVGLIITVDCGISSYNEVEEAKSKGIDVIITDHHLKPPKVPRTIIVHPEGYPNEGLTGVGVAFKLAHALYQHMNLENWKTKLYNLMDLVAVGTIADLGVLLGENRLLVKHGLNVLSNGTAKAGFKAIYKGAGISPPIKTWHISFVIAPRLNAAGRLKTAMKSFELLTKTRGKDAKVFAEEIERLNRERQKLQNRIYDMLLREINGDEPVVFAYAEGLHEGVIGIVASKLSETFNKPAFVISVKGETSKGSARGIEPFNVFESLNTIGEIFENYGGHALAGGFTIKTHLLEKLRKHLNDYALKVAPGGFKKTIKIDAEVFYEDLIGDDFWRDKYELEPYGPGFPEPVLLLKNTRKTVISSDNSKVLVLGDKGICEFNAKGKVRGKGDLVITNLRRGRDGTIYGDVLGEI